MKAAQIDLRVEADQSERTLQTELIERN